MDEPMERSERFYSMIKTFIILAFSIISVGFGLMLWFSYCAGRWGKISFVGAEIVGFVVIIAGVLISALCLRKSIILQKVASSILYRYVTIVIFVTMLAAMRAASFNLLLYSYAAGFEKTALEVAPIEKWKSLLPLAQTFLSAHNSNRTESILPTFVRKVYPSEPPHCGISGEPGDLNVGVFWRQPTLVIGIIIGRHGSMNNELYRKRCADDVAVVIAR